MRRLAYAAVCVSLVLAAACTDTQAPTEPSQPEPDQSLGSCRVTRFPAVQVGGLVLQVFAPGRNRVEALVRTAAVALLWDTCHPALARQGAVLFVNWIDRNAPSNAAPAKVIALKVAILNGVGIPVATPPAGFQNDFGVGTFDPANPNKTLIKTTSGRALVQLDPGSFLELTVITISRKLNAFQLSDFDGRQFPPKYDYDAINASGKKVLETGKKAIVAFCLLGLDDVAFPGGYPAHPRIGHNPVAGAPGFPFEILEEVDLAAENLDDDLSPAVCGHNPGPGPIGGFGRTPSGYANAALRMAERYLGPILLPKPLWATALGTLPPPPPIGGRAPSLSPFGVVEANPDFTVQNSGETDPVGGTFTAGQPIDLCSGDSCGPAFRIDNGDGHESGTITATLIPGDGSTGTLSGTTSVATDAYGIAEFNNLIVSAAGTYQLKFAAANSVPYVTGTFRVASAGVTELACNQEGTVKSLESNRGVQLEFVNNTTRPVAVYWLNFDGVRQYPFIEGDGDGIGEPYTVLAPGTSFIQETYVTHPWLLESDDESAICYGIFLPGTQDGEVAVP